MLTRISVDGFKSVMDFELDVPPFLALVGPTSSGKSNLFDAVDFARSALLHGSSHQNLDPLLEARRGKAPGALPRAAGAAAAVAAADRGGGPVRQAGRADHGGGRGRTRLPSRRRLAS